MRRATFRAVTLLDTLFVMMVIAFAVLPALGVMIYVENNSAQTRQMQHAVFLANQQLEDLRMVFPSFTPNAPTGSPTVTTSTDTTSEGIPYNITLTETIAANGIEYECVDTPTPAVVATSPVPMIVDVTVDVSYPESVYPVSLSTRLYRHMGRMERP
ncbi:MAG TPA: hypothetical protein VGO93_25945 [Candidatus Xenobia bacterium]|jgi:type II secretory pathway pseudopilin PulG